MGWNPFDRRSADQKTIDDALVDLPKPSWEGGRSGPSARFVSEALASWRTAGPAATPTDAATAGRLNRVRQVIDRDRVSSASSTAEVADLLALRKSVCGSATYALASSVETLDAWKADEVAHRIVRIDLSSEVQSVARSASLLHAAFLRLGDAPRGHLSDDAEVQEIYTKRVTGLADRQKTLCLRLTALRSYLDGLMDIQRELEKVRWIERHGYPDVSELEVQVGDELASHNVTAARDMFAAATDRIGVRLQEAAERLSDSK